MRTEDRTGAVSAKAIAFLCALGGVQGAYAADYYVDSVAGNDANAGTSVSAPWRTLAKVNTYLSASAVAPAVIEPGDTVNFKRGGLWNESLVIRRSGINRSRISFRAYGDSGDMPTIRGSVPVGTGTAGSGWVQDGLLWKTTVGVPLNARQLTYTKDGITTVLPFARYPNVGIGADIGSGSAMLRTQSALTCQSLGATSTAEPAANFNPRTCGLIYVANSTLAAQSLSGADVIIRDGQFRFDRRRIVSSDANALTMTWVSGTVTATTPVAQLPTTYILNNYGHGIGGGYGFFVAGKAWMIDQPGEWAIETTTVPRARTLYLRTPDGLPPGEDSVRISAAASGAPTVGIDAQGRQGLIIDGLQVVDATIGLELSGSENVLVSGVRVLRSVLIGIRGDGSSGLTLSENWIQQSGVQGVAAQSAADLVISGNDIIEVGTHLPPDGDVITAGPNGRNHFGIYALAPNGATISENRLADAAYIGIFAGWSSAAGSSSTVSGNSLVRTCMYLDDCGALYTGGRSGLDTGVTFSNNFVNGVSGSEVGRPFDANGNPTGSSAQGIYLDDFAQNVLVEDNLVVDADHGIQIHLGRHNTIQNNIVVASRKSDIWFQEDRLGNDVPVETGTSVCADTANCIVANTVSENFYVGLPGVPNYILDSATGDTSDFASFHGNRYANWFSGFLVRNRWLAGGQQHPWVTHTWADWQTVLGNDFSSHVSGRRLASLSAYAGSRGADLIANSEFTANTAGWETWSEPVSPLLGLASSGGVNGSYARFQATSGPRDSILNTNVGFVIEAGKRYLLRFAVRSEIGAVNAYAKLRNRSGMGGLSPDYNFTATNEWQYFEAPLLATATADGLEGRPLARLDFQVPPNAVLNFDDVQVAEMTSLPNRVTNGDFTSNVASWSMSSPAGGYSVTHDTGGFAVVQASAGTADSTLYTTANFGVQLGRQYLVRFAVRSQAADATAFAVIRRTSNYQPLSERLSFTATGTWQYHYGLVTATDTADGTGGTPYARLDFQMPPGSTIELDDVLLTELTAIPVPASSLIQVFPGGPLGLGSYDCPNAGTALAYRCSTYLDVRTGLPISWPLSVPQFSLADSVIAVALEASFKDSDGDGVTDVNDHCPLTPAGARVDERGCSYEQRHAP